MIDEAYGRIGHRHVAAGKIGLSACISVDLIFLQDKEGSSIVEKGQVLPSSRHLGNLESVVALSRLADTVSAAPAY